MKRAYSNRDLIATLDVDRDYEAIYQRTVLYDFGTDARVGLNLAFYRIFAIPHMAELLVRTGEITARPAKRAYDTGLVMYELIANGFDKPTRKEMVSLINRAHRPWPISDDDYRYVLAAFIVVPMRWIQRRGWRPLLDVELDASCAFYHRLAVLMAIPRPPANYAEAEQILDTYEKQHLAPSNAGRQLMEVTQDIVVRKLPKPVRRFGPILTSSLLDQPNLSDALGLPRPNRGVGVLLRCGFSMRNGFQRMRPAATLPWFQPGRAVSNLYPNGYALDDPWPGQYGQHRAHAKPEITGHLNPRNGLAPHRTRPTNGRGLRCAPRPPRRLRCSTQTPDDRAVAALSSANTPKITKYRLQY